MEKVASKQPNLFVIGAAKAGTTSLSHYLSSHPEIFIAPIKEPHYFSNADIDIDAMRPIVKRRFKRINMEKYIENRSIPKIHNYYFQDLDSYLKLFTNVEDEKIIGECSTSYLWSRSAAQKIYTIAPDSKIIVVLRNPVDRAYSHYLMEKRLFSNKMSFEEALAKDLSLGDRTWEVYPMYHELGKYYTQLKRYYDLFPAKNILPIVFEKYKAERYNTMLKIYDFLNVSTDINIDTSKEYNTGLLPRNNFASWILTQTDLKQTFQKNINSETLAILKKIVYTKPVKGLMSEQIRSKLANYYRDEIEELQSLIAQDLTHWMRTE